MKEDITSTYERWYEGKYKRAELQEKAALVRGVEWIGEVKTVLEIGCGTAHFTRWFEEMGLSPYGIDISPFMLKEAKKLWTGDRLARATSSKLPLKSKTVDVAGFITCFEYMPEPLAAVREACRVARRGLFFGLMNSWSVPTMRRRIQIALGKNPYYKTARFYSLPSIKGVIEKAIGREKYELFARSTVFPVLVPLRYSRLPFGAFLCVCVRLVK